MRKRYLKKIVSSILAVSLIASSINIVGAADKESIEEGSIKEVQSEKLEDIDILSQPAKNGYIDAGIEYGRIPDYSLYSFSGYDKAEVVPQAYDSRTYGHVTSVKNQNPWGTCWAHAAVAAMESYALSHGLVSKPEDINLSEFALAYLTFEDEDMLLAKTGDYSDTTDSNVGFDAGGNDEMAYKALSNGLALYDDDEVQYAQSASSNAVPKIVWDENNISYVLTGQKFINMSDTAQVKKAVMENGAVTTSYYSDDAFMNSNYLYNYNYKISSTNHAVVIVGWDDNKDKSLFTVSDGTNSYTPKNNGAWLIKNSWGTWFGDAGYIWISYEDMGILSSDAVYYEIAPKSEYPNLYQHDGATLACNFTYGYSFASVFEVEGKKEKVNALSFYIYDTQMGYTAYLYDNSNGKELDEGELIASTSGITTYAGYYTVDFDTDYVFMEGDKFSVIIEFASQTAMAYSPDTVNYAAVGNTYSTCESGQSYITKYTTQGFQDVAELGTYMNISLKAHSVSVTDKSTPTQIKELSVIGDNQVSVQWKPIEDAVSYELWKGTSENGDEYKVITGITQTSYIDSNIADSLNPEDLIKFGETYYYKVRAKYSDGTYNDYSNIKSVEILPAKTTTKVDIVDNKLSITWDKLDYADGYIVYIGEDYEDAIVKVAEVTADTTSYIYDATLNYYKDYYVAVEAYVKNSQENKIYGKYDVVKISASVKEAQMIETSYLVEDSIYLEWELLDGNLAHGIYIKIRCNGLIAWSDFIETTGTSYILDISRFEAGDSLDIECSIYYQYESGSYATNTFYSENIEVLDTYDHNVLWYVKDNQLYVCIPDAEDTTYEIYYGYDEAKAGFSNSVQLTKEEIEAGYPLPVGSCPITGCSIGVRMAPDFYNHVIPKELIKVGGTYKVPQLQTIPNVRATSSGEGIKLQAVIQDKVAGFNYEYQWYVSDFKNGTATSISGATSAEYVAYVGDAEAKYYYCQVTCMYNGDNVYTTTNENGERTRVLGKSCFDNIYISNVEIMNYTGSAIKPTVTVMEDDTTLTPGTHYTVTYENNINAGTGIIKITFKGAYSTLGTKIVEFEIKPKSIDSISIGAISEQMYTGSQLTPAITAKDGSYTLVNGKDYLVSYANNINSGTATVTLTGKGNYFGTKKTIFTIKSVPEKITSSNVTVTDKSSSISKITSGTTVAAFVSKLNESKYVAVYKGNAKVENTALIGTGMIACIMDGNKITKKYTVIITGDTSGDGKINITDMIAVKANILKKTMLAGVYSKAGDVNGDDKINITDFIKIKATLLGKDSIAGVAVE